MLVLCLLAVCLAILAIHRAEVIHASETYDEIYEIKRTFLKDTVHNVIRNIDNIRTFNVALADEVRARLVAEIVQLHAKNSTRFAEDTLALLERGKYPGAVNLQFEDTATGRLLFSTPGTGTQDLPASRKEYRFSNYRLRIALNSGWVDDNTKASVASMLHDQRYENGGYIWVNEILDWKGGDAYAIRRIHPNLKDTEGSYLSTKTRDINGNLPYLEELEGVRERGEAFFTYYFKRPDNDRIAEKLTYATLYKDYQWIIAMGVYLEDVQTYIDAVEATSRVLTMRIIAYAVVGFLVLFLLALLFLSRMEKRYFAMTSRVILEESNQDSLTGAYNRRMGDHCLADTFNKFRHGTESSALLLFDIDDFKRVNDQWGHKTGDRVLVAITDLLKQNMRSSDHLIRWGGEEFLIVCYGLGEAEVTRVAEKLKDLIASMEVQADGADIGAAAIRVTVSFGVAWFLSGDHGPDAAFQRADAALYRAKAAGKNRVQVQGSE